jgi:asparagine synthase (glutamine-hydrolysing)
VCGIAGVYAGAAAAAVTEEEIRGMMGMLHHRGPDGHGLYISPRIGLGNTRLSIVDIDGGFQPLCNERQDVWLVHNGEIFNHVELRADLIARGHRFATSSDSEAIIHAYEEHGADTWNVLNGQFAIALWDRRSAELWLVRDRLGINPLHYALVGGSVVFGSEAKAILAGRRIAAAPDPQGLIDTFTRWSPSAPDSVFAGIRQVRPGTSMRFDANLRPSEHRYWSVAFPTRLPGSPGSDDPVDRLDEAADRLNTAMTEAVRLRLRADVPVGAYLSGGLDSSYIAALIRREHSGRLDTFGIRFQDPLYDETDEQRGMAAVLGTEHHEVMCTADDIASAVPSVVWHAEQPLLRTAPIPMYILSGLVRATGFKVAMTGEGSDEWFAGYSILKEDRVRRFWARDPGSTMRPALLARIHPEIGRDRARQSPFWRSFFGQGLDQPDHPLFSHLPRWQSAAWTTRLLSTAILAGGSVEASYTAVTERLPEGWRSWSPLARAQAIEIETFMSSYLLAAQGDRMGLGHGVELRYPFLDPNVAELALAMPDRFKLSGLRDKVVLRRAASKVLPREVWERPKQPFRAPPMSSALLGAPGGYFDSLLTEASIRRVGLLDTQAVRHLVDRGRSAVGRMPGEREEMALIGAVTLQAWGERFLGSMDADVAAGLERLGQAPPRVIQRHPNGEPFAAGTAAGAAS